MLRKLTSTILILTMLLLSTITAMATSTTSPEVLGVINQDVEKDFINESTSASQTEYMERLDLIDKSENFYNDYLKAATETFLSLRRANIRNLQEYDTSVMISPPYKSSNNILYRTKSDEYYSKMLDYDNRIIQWDDIKFRDCSVIIDGDKASVEIVEDYIYYIDDKFKKTSYKTTKYNLSFEKLDEKWVIINIVTNDPWETAPDFQYYDFDVDAEISAKTNKLENEIATNDLAEDDLFTTRGVPLMYYSYSRSDAVEYAEDWYDGVNPVFGQASEDCQNFASQVVWAGLGAGSTTALPVVYDSTYGSTNVRLWQHNNYCESQTSSAVKGYGWHWDNVDGFFWQIDTSSNLVEGPYGTVKFNLDCATEGDVIAIDTSSTSPSIGTLDHAMVVTEVTGTYGNRDTDDIFIAAHNDETSSAYQSLDDYTGYKSESHFATAHITGGYYY